MIIELKFLLKKYLLDDMDTRKEFFVHVHDVLILWQAFVCVWNISVT